MIAFNIIYQSLVVTCWERADLLAVVCAVVSCVLSLSQMRPGLHQIKPSSKIFY